MSEHPNYGSVEDPTSTWLGPTHGVTGEMVRGRRSLWAGWIAFASLMMIMMGAFNAIEGLTGVLVDDFYVTTTENVLVFDVTTWGWIHLVVGVLVAITGAALLTGAAWARVLTVVFAILNAVAQLAFAAVYPVWSLIVISLCVVVIWAVVVHGDEAIPEDL